MARTAKLSLFGGSGFVGAALARGLAEEGFSVGAPRRAEIDLENPSCVDALSRELDGATAVFAARIDDERAAARTLRAALSRSSPERLIWFSSLSVYGDATTDLAITERTPLSPQSPYAQAKADAEKLLGEAGVPLLILRPCKIYGPGAPASEYGPASFIAAAKAGTPARVYGDASELRDHFYVNDVVAAVAALVRGNATGVVNLASGRSHPIREILEIVGKLRGRRLEVEETPRTRPKVDQKVDVSLLKKLAPGLELTDLPQGLERTWLR